MWCAPLWQASAGPPAGGKGMRQPASGDQKEESPSLSLVTALPLSVWRWHLTPVLSLRCAARPREVCKALKALVRDWPMHLENLLWDDLEAALKCFPATESTKVCPPYGTVPTPAEERRMVEVLRAHGATLKEMRGYPRGESVWPAVRAGAFPNLIFMNLTLQNPICRQILSDGMLELLRTGGDSPAT
jgi:hypothetical protein